MPNLKNSRPKKIKKSSLLVRGFKKKAEEISAEYRQLLNIKSTDPLPALKLAEYLQIHVKETRDVEGITTQILSELLDIDFGTGISAITLFCPANNRHMVIHNHTHSAGRKESNLMHEFAHLILNHKMEEFDSTNGFVLRNYNAVQEEEAGYLGFCLQLPEAALKKHYVYDEKTKQEISDLFTATIEAVNYRIGILGIEQFKFNLKKKYK